MDWTVNTTMLLDRVHLILGGSSAITVLVLITFCSCLLSGSYPCGCEANSLEVSAWKTLKHQTEGDLHFEGKGLMHFATYNNWWCNFASVYVANLPHQRRRDQLCFCNSIPQIPQQANYVWACHECTACHECYKMSEGIHLRFIRFQTRCLCTTQSTLKLPLVSVAATS